MIKNFQLFHISGKHDASAHPYIAMKNFIYLITALALTCCADRFSSRYILELPDVPSSWVSLLGEPHWRVERINPDGQKQIEDFPPAMKKNIEAEIPDTWANPVTAWPYWPESNLPPCVFKPAGAVFPFDVREDRLCLSWEAGTDSIFYWELANSASAHGYKQEDKKIPMNFDWPRFRELFLSDALSEAVREDPWTVNWRSAAEKTIESNFDRRRIVPEAAVQKRYPVPCGSWYGTSPFAKPLFFTEKEQPVFPVRSGINVWISTEGILKVSGNTWVFSKIRD